MDRYQSLFESDLSVQSHIVGRLEPLIPKLWESIATPFLAYRDRVAKNDSYFVNLETDGVAQHLHHAIKQQAARIFRGHVGAKLKPGKCGTARMLHLAVDGDDDPDGDKPIRVSLKKFCEREETFLRSNYSTKHQRRYWRDGRMLFDPGYRVIFGYVLTEANTNFETYLTYPVGGKRNAWCVPIPTQAAVLERLRDEKEAAAAVEQERETRKGWEVLPQEDRDAAKDRTRRAGGAG